MNQSWQDSIRKSFRKNTTLETFLDTPVADIKDYPLLLPNQVALKIKDQGKSGSLYKQFVPSESEIDDKLQLGGLHDPIGDAIKAKGGGIIHRYDNRILFTPTNVCPINCRYCFRKNELGDNEVFGPNLAALESYLVNHPGVDEVILTGGDPLVLSNKKLAQCLETIAKAPSVKFVRLHSRTPVILPERIDSGFLEIINKFSKRFKLILAIHTNHLSEFDNQINETLLSLASKPITLLSQTVLLKDVNDSVESLVELFFHLDKLGIRPYYLHHPDKVLGALHFYISHQEGENIYRQLRMKLPGWMIPHYVVDSPTGSGKELAVGKSQLD